MEFIRSTIKRKSWGSSSGDSACSPDEKKQKESSGDIILKAFNMAERMAEGLAEKVDLILSKLSKLDKLDQIELRLNNLTTSVSSIEMSVSRLEKEVSALDSKTKTIDKSVNVLKESVSFCEDEIEEMKKNAYDIKDGCTSDIEELRKQFLYLEHYSRRENLKFLGIPERIISADEDDDRPSEDTKALVYKALVYGGWAGDRKLTAENWIPTHSPFGKISQEWATSNPSPISPLFRPRGSFTAGSK